LDAINVHPFEFVVGEYIHLLTIYVVPCHIYAVVVFILAGGVLASLNHTRYDVSIPYLYSVKVHDVHHRLPMSNYGQYTMLWDRIFGTYRSYDITLNSKDD
jgi:sterol desaturase/sphingolipid hydroxylase (fatty acid hydroxylase superfamily)